MRLGRVIGIVKTHRLTYATSLGLVALAKKENCPYTWTVSSRILRDWIEHFWSTSKYGKSIVLHLKFGITLNGKKGTEEITLLCGKTTCKLQSHEQYDEPNRDKGEFVSVFIKRRRQVLSSIDWLVSS
jgi:Rad9